MMLFLVSQYSIAVLSRAYAPCVDDVTDEYPPVTDLARMGYTQDDIHRRFCKLVAADDVRATRSMTSVEYCTPR